jgi:hypothetical protein
MGRVWEWVKKNKLASVLLVVVGWWVLGGLFGVRTINLRSMAPLEVKDINMMGGVTNSFYANDKVAPSTSQERMVVTETSMSLVVKNVQEAVGKLKLTAEQAGGFMVNYYVSSPLENASGNVVVRVPSKSLDAVLAAYRAIGVRVTNERVVGTDVTDQYEDLDAKLKVMYETKAKFEEIMDQAVQIQDIVNIQERLISLQRQIDDLVGQQKYLEKTAALAKVTVYVSTDQYSLPYSPAQPWRPDAVFNSAVRSLVVNLRSLGSAAIWLAVYSVFWVPVVGVVWWFRRRHKV